MNLKSLLVSSDEKTVRVLRRVLSDLEIAVEHCSTSAAAVHRITRSRFEAIIVDAAHGQAAHVLQATKAAPVNKRALAIILVENNIGLKGGFEMGAHFVLHKPLAVERAKASFRAVRALMKSERRLQMRVPVDLPVTCIGSSRFPARTIDLCEGGMAIQFTARRKNEPSLRFALELPGPEKGVYEKLEIAGELAWQDEEFRAGVRFTDATGSQRSILRKWLAAQLETEPDDPPVPCRLKDLSDGGCYLTTSFPFPKSSRVILSAQIKELGILANGVVRITHPEFGMGIEFLQSRPEQKKQVRQFVETLRAASEPPELHVEANGLHLASEEALLPGTSTQLDILVRLFHEQAHDSVEGFLERIQQTRQPQELR